MGSLIVALGPTTGIVETNAGSGIDEKLVKCQDDSIQKEVDDADKPTIIFIQGVCDEVVTITRDDITLDGQGVGTVSGTVTFDRANAESSGTRP